MEGGEPAEGAVQGEARAAFPPPPPWWRRCGGPGEGEGEGAGAGAGAPFRPPALPGAGSTYPLFGVIEDTKDALPELAVEQLYAAAGKGGGVDAKRELARLHGELLAAFKRCVGALAEDAGTWEAQVQQVRLLLHNMMHLLNLLRPAQARRDLQRLLERQLAANRAALEEVQRESAAATAAVGAALDRLVEAAGEEEAGAGAEEAAGAAGGGGDAMELG